MDRKFGRLIQDSDTARKGEHKCGCKYKQTDKDRQTKRLESPRGKKQHPSYFVIFGTVLNMTQDPTGILWLLDHFYQLRGLVHSPK